MFRNDQSLRKLRIAAAAFALCTSAAAIADDSSMSMWTGDSYAFFNNLDYNPGQFNTARATQSNEDDATQMSLSDERQTLGRHVMMVNHPLLLRRPSAVTQPSQITRPPATTRTNPFRDDTGQ